MYTLIQLIDGCRSAKKPAESTNLLQQTEIKNLSGDIEEMMAETKLNESSRVTVTNTSEDETEDVTDDNEQRCR